MLSRTLLLAACALTLPGVDLPGVPGPTPTGDEHLRLHWSNDAFGPGMGRTTDDFRTNALAIAGWHGRWFAGLDHSILTATNPSGTPMQWSLPDPTANQGIGAARIDELTVSGGAQWRERAGVLGWRLAGGAGLRWSGDLGGSAMQSSAHGVLVQDQPDLPYERRALQTRVFAHGAAGLELRGEAPLGLRLDALSTLDDDGRWRWRSEVLAVAHGTGGGMWAGLRNDGAQGGDLGVVQRGVDRHEGGAALVAGWDWRNAAWGMGLEAMRAVHGGGQMGVVRLAWVPPVHASTAPDPGLWAGRVGVADHGGSNPARGLTWALSRRLGSSTWAPDWQVGYLDQEVEVYFRYDAAVARRLLWSGLALRPQVITAGPLGVHLLGEAGLGWQRVAAEGRGASTINGAERQVIDDLAVRLAGGLEGTVGSLGLFVLAEETLAPDRSVTSVVRDDLNGTVYARRVEAVSGTVSGVSAGLSATWNW
ncbi:MAG TPA: hypothetical protein DCS97_11925 [Planctomycetes bacterium]|nr:hypothetical protein [Planctomycetota bacterium]